MAFTIIWSRQARDDLRDIVTFMAANNRPVAESFGFRLMTKVDMLAQFPRLGRIVPEERDENIREVVLPPYRIFIGFWRNEMWLPLPAFGMVREANRKFQFV